MRRGRLAAASAVALLAGAAAAAPHRVVDLRRQSESPERQREISFCARPSPGAAGLPGHAFVAFSHRDDRGRRVFRAVGHTPSAPAGKAALSYGGLLPVRGHLAEERYTSIQEKCLVVRVDRRAYERALATTRSPLARAGIGKPDDPVLMAYSLGERDCMTYMISVAQGLSLRIPRRSASDLPLQYIRRFIDAN